MLKYFSINIICKIRTFFPYLKNLHGSNNFIIIFSLEQDWEKKEVNGKSAIWAKNNFASHNMKRLFEAFEDNR